MKLFFLLLSMALSYCLTAQNLVTSGDNGTFEAEGCELEIVNFSYMDVNNSAEGLEINRVNFQGKNCLKLELPTPCCGSNSSAFRMPVLGNLPYPFVSGPELILLKAKIFIPSVDDNGVSQNNANQLHFTTSGVPLGGSGGWGGCGSGTNGIFNDLPKDTWFDIFTRFYAYFTDDRIIVLYSTAKIQFYIDDVVMKLEPNEITNQATINGFNITLNPTSALSELGLPFNYHWGDGVNTKDRENLTPGKYSVVVSQACESKTYVYDIPLLPPPISTSIDICSGTPGQLFASGAPNDGVNDFGYFWYDDSFTLIGNETHLNVAPLNPGLFTYHVAISMNGKLASSRTEVFVRVNGPNPLLTFKTTVINTFPFKVTAQNHQSGNQYSYSFQYGIGDDLIDETVDTDQAILSYTFEDKGSGYPALGHHNCRVKVTDVNGCSSYYDFEVEVKDIEPLCEVTIPLVSATDDFSLDKFSGRFVTRRNCDVDISLGCVQAKPQAPQFTNVVSASATTYSDQWNYTYLGTQSGNDYENGQRGKWRPQASYAYNVPINYQATPENHRAGTFSLSHFNWQYPATSTKSGWLKTNTIEYYTPNGDPVQERNALNIASVAKFGYGGAVPYLIAQNAEYEQVMFESFENATGTSLEDGVSASGGSRTTANAHAGTYSLQLTGTFTSRTIAAKGKNIQVRFWLKGDVSALQVSPSSGSTIPDGFNKVAASGAWTLYEAIVQPGSSQSVSVFFVKLPGGSVWLDDVRLQPMDAAMTCYVYEVGTLRLLTVFDDQHFGLYYQYNDEGKLVRKQVETERGLKTIQETQYNLPQKAKDNP